MSKIKRRYSSEYSSSFSEVHQKSISNPTSFDKEEVFDPKKERINRSILYKKFFSSLQPIIGIISSFFVGCGPVLLFFLFGRVLNAHHAYAVDPSYDAMKEIIDNCIYLIDVALALGIFKCISTYIWGVSGSNFANELKSGMFESMMKSEVTFFDTNPVGGLLSLLSEDSQFVESAFGSMKGSQIQNLGQFVIGLILAYVYAWKLALIATVVIPVSIVIINFFSKFVNQHVEIQFGYIAESVTIAEESFSAIRTVRGFNQEKNDHKRFMTQVKKDRHEDRLVNLFLLGLYTSTILLQNGILLVYLYIGGLDVINGSMPSGNLLSVYGYLLFSEFGFVEFQSSFQSEQKAISSGGRILDFTSRTSTIPFEGGKKIKNFKGKIEFENVSFKYPTRDVFVLKNISFVIEAGQIGALVGHSGSGKSTCIQLLERYYECDSGVIRLDGVNIKELDPRWLHRKIGLVSQEPILFNISIKDNIKYGARKASDKQVQNASEVANAVKFINKFDQKFNTIVGEKGSNISGGQRQRIAIARAVLKNPVILMTDEATSALDSKNEKKVQEALDKVMKNRTAVIVAHRLSTIRNAHIIYVFDSGEIKEYGTHEELVARKSFYYELVKKQISPNEGNENNKDNSSKKRPKIIKPKSDQTSSSSNNNKSESDSSQHATSDESDSSST
ncbi:ATP-binding cassette sub-family B member 10, mitochondrial [Tritrichomonas foetus]|uniref:ATP-binding cassette sub-family B member 10, mitochondrial n=1 Tax=Tritrichomonas foetus TaxID=1144522 RepID=A0A1J4KJ81_9EUKA|nr:ATP-binding cassette sub-family B member 10, mitochondrial [Tritrichomonas foetus]|eukprot:OHT11401.1 ATP-binding cassette sub-family B member 10, mitochondrial [Tritrichomonas foetus]